MNYIFQIKKRCDSEGMQFYFISFPFIRTPSEAPLSALERRYEMRLKGYLAEEKIKYLFLSARFNKQNPKDLMISIFDAYPNKKVNKIAAEALFCLLKPQLEIFLRKEDGHQDRITRKGN